jgi:hypothetical protein
MPAWLTGIGAKIALAAAFVGLVLLAVLRLIGIGRKAERGEAAIKGMERTQEANEARQKASQPVSKEAEDADPYNRDR